MEPAFVGRRQGSAPVPGPSGMEFDSQFRWLLAGAGLDTKLYSVHSLRRGGATFAESVGVSTDLIRTMGDWRSDAYRCYVDASHQRRTAADCMAQALLRSSL